jgi:hypothetical protein
MKVKISDLLLWQWDTTMTIYNDGVEFTKDDERIVQELVAKWKVHGYFKCRCIPPIAINRSISDLNDCLTPKAIAQFKSGKWMVWNGFHRIHAAIRLGKKTIRAEIC